MSEINKSWSHLSDKTIIKQQKAAKQKWTEVKSTQFINKIWRQWLVNASNKLPKIKYLLVIDCEEENNMLNRPLDH